MLKYLKLVAVFIVIFGSSKLHAQSRIGVGSQIPVQYQIAYEFETKHNLIIGTKFGLIAPPFDGILIDIMDRFGADDEILGLVTNTFERGITIQPEIGYNFGFIYSKVLFQAVLLRAGISDPEDFESFFDVELDRFPRRRPRVQTEVRDVKIQSDLFQVGLIIGKNFRLSSDNALSLELGFARNVYSVSDLSSTQADLSALDQEVNSELSKLYREYVYEPILTLKYVYSF